MPNYTANRISFNDEAQYLKVKAFMNRYDHDDLIYRVDAITPKQIKLINLGDEVDGIDQPVVLDTEHVYLDDETFGQPFVKLSDDMSIIKVGDILEDDRVLNYDDDTHFIKANRYVEDFQFNFNRLISNKDTIHYIKRPSPEGIVLEQPKGDERYWYNFNVNNWGTKWNAQSVEYDDYQCEIAFMTAWAAVPDIVTAMFEKFHQSPIIYAFQYEDEDHATQYRLTVENQN